MIRNRLVKVDAQKPAKRDIDPNLLLQLPLGGYPVEIAQKEHFHQQNRIDRRSAHFGIQRLGAFRKLVVEFQVFCGVEPEEERIAAYLSTDILIDSLNRLGEGDAIGNRMEMSPSLCLDRTLHDGVIHKKILVIDQAMPPVGLQDMA